VKQSWANMDAEIFSETPDSFGFPYIALTNFLKTNFSEHFAQ
jgi:hypothetical protein